MPANGKTLLMISKVGVAVKAGAPKPDVGTADKFKAALLAAKRDLRLPQELAKLDRFDLVGEVIDSPLRVVRAS